jgi:hypothetical protein
MFEFFINTGSSPILAAIRKVHRLGGLKQQLFLTVLEARKSQIKVLADSMSDEDLLSDS